MINHNSADFGSWEAEFPENVPYGADMLVDLTPEAAAGVLACINGLASPGNDDAQPYPPGSGAIDDQYEAFGPSLAEDVDSLV